MPGRFNLSWPAISPRCRASDSKPPPASVSLSRSQGRPLCHRPFRLWHSASSASVFLLCTLHLASGRLVARGETGRVPSGVTSAADSKITAAVVEFFHGGAGPSEAAISRVFTEHGYFDNYVYRTDIQGPDKEQRVLQSFAEARRPYVRKRCRSRWSAITVPTSSTRVRRASPLREDCCHRCTSPPLRGPSPRPRIGRGRSSRSCLDFLRPLQAGAQAPVSP